MPRKKTEQPDSETINIEKLHQLCVAQFGMIRDMITNIDRRCSELDNKLQSVMDKTSGCSSGTFSKVEDKVDFLNQNKTNVKNMSISDFINKHIIVFDEDIVNIFKAKKTIYEIATKSILDLYKSSSHDFVFAFAFQKYTLYFWNEDKMSWDKMDKIVLKNIFEIIQKKLITLYTNLIENNNNHLKGLDIVENGDKLFVDNFDKKFTEFKKLIFQAITEC